MSLSAGISCRSPQTHWAITRATSAGSQRLFARKLFFGEHGAKHACLGGSRHCMYADIQRLPLPCRRQSPAGSGARLGRLRHAAQPGKWITPATDETFTIEPPPPFLKTGDAARISKNGAVRFTAKTLPHCSGVVFFQISSMEHTPHYSPGHRAGRIARRRRDDSLRLPGSPTSARSTKLMPAPEPTRLAVTRPIPTRSGRPGPGGIRAAPIPVPSRGQYRAQRRLRSPPVRPWRLLQVSPKFRAYISWSRCIEIPLPWYARGGPKWGFGTQEP